MTCTHTLKFETRGGGHRCSCCGRYKASVVLCVDCSPKSEPRQKPVDFSKEVEPATTGTCMFCSGPEAKFAFVGDDSVRLCSKCVKG